MIPLLLHKMDGNPTEILSKWYKLISLKCYKMYIRVSFCKCIYCKKVNLEYLIVETIL